MHIGLSKERAVLIIFGLRRSIPEIEI